MHNMNEICTNCEHSFKEHEPEGDGAFWCPDREDSFFVPSGRALVRVDFITAVRELIKKADILDKPVNHQVNIEWIEYLEAKHKVRSMLPDESDKKGEPRGKANDDNRGY